MVAAGSFVDSGLKNSGRLAFRQSGVSSSTACDYHLRLGHRLADRKAHVPELCRPSGRLERQWFC
jgi:hypothetical protein